MAHQTTCPQCGDPMPADSPHGVCPKCFLGLGFADPNQLDPTIAGGGRFDPPKPNQLAQHFPQLEILDLIGQGGMGAVYKARQPGLDRLVALKILPPQAGRDPAFAERFAREARALAKLSHPNIVSVFDFGEAGGLFYIVMEYIDGIDLRQAIRSGELTATEALAIVPQVCDALQYAHEEGVVHRDIKPENILMDKRGRVKIADFGLARILDPSRNDLTLTGTHQVMGTPHYMAPEQMERTHSVDHRADIYSLGVVFYEMLTSELPLGRFALPSQKVRLDVRLDDIVLRTLEKEPDRRYQHASDLKSDVETISGVARFGAYPGNYGGYEYRSKATIFGLPLIHIAKGIDPTTGRKRVAKGIIAVGDVAVGVFAMGGAAVGGVVFGGLAVGLVTFGGASLGLLLAIGGLAVGCGFSLGGFAVGTVAIGGGAIGIYAFGGGAFGWHALGGNARDPEALRLFQQFLPQGPQVVSRIMWIVILGMSLFWIIFAIVSALLPQFRRREERVKYDSAIGRKQDRSDRGVGCLVALLLAIVSPCLLAVLLIPAFVIVRDSRFEGQSAPVIRSSEAPTSHEPPAPEPPREVQPEAGRGNP